MKLRVLSYNIHKCIGGVDRKYVPERVRDVIAHHDPDFVCLQEVDRGVPRSRGHSQVDLLGDMLGLRHRTWFPNHRLRNGGEYGNAILSRFPLTETQNVDLTMPLRKRRSVLHARFRVRVGKAKTRTVHVFNLHLGLTGGERVKQLVRFLGSNPFHGLHGRTPVILAGDFNDVWTNLGRKILKPAGFHTVERPAKTFPAWRPVRALDSIYVRGDVRLMGLATSRLQLAKQASDHLPLVADLVVTS